MITDDYVVSDKDARSTKSISNNVPFGPGSVSRNGGEDSLTTGYQRTHLDYESKVCQTVFCRYFCPFFFAWVLIVSIGAQLEPGRASELSMVKVNDWN